MAQASQDDLLLYTAPRALRVGDFSYSYTYTYIYIYLYIYILLFLFLNEREVHGRVYEEGDWIFRQELGRVRKAKCG